MHSIRDKSLLAIQDYYRFLVLMLHLCQPRGESDDSQQAFKRLAKAIRALQTRTNPDQEIALDVLDHHRHILGLIEHLENNPLDPEARRDPYGWLRSIITDRANGVYTSGC